MSMNNYSLLAGLLLAAFVAACGGNQAPDVVPDGPFADAPAPAASAPPPPTRIVEDAPPLAAPAFADDSISNRTLDELNRASPFEPVFFALDRSELDAAGRAVAAANARILENFPSWVITIEGHCDERGTAEYNLALGERRAVAVKTYLVSLGIAADRIRTVSYGKEFPFDSGHNDEAWAANRRGHFVVTAQ